MTVVDEGQATPLSTQPAPPTRPSGRGPIPAIRGFWRRLTSMRTALLLLALLALAAIPGTLIPQRNLDPVKVDQYISDHPHLGRVMDKLALFNVFASPWFAAIYLLLFISLIGCLIPRIRLHAKALRRRPPNAPRHLMRMTASTQWETTETPEEFATRAHTHLRRGRWRADLRPEDDGVVTVASEKGYLRETGNLLFHVSLVALLIGIALGGLYGYKGTKLLTAGRGFANARESYDVFQPSKLFSDSQLAPFSFSLDHFDAKYTQSGEPTDFNAFINYSSAPGQPVKPYDLRVNHPLDVDGAKVFLVGHGYALDLQIKNPAGKVISSGDVPFLPDNTQFVSHGVIKSPHVCIHIRPQCAVSQLGFTGFFYPTAAVTPSGGLTSSNPALKNPLLVLQAWKGDLGLQTGVPQSVYSLNVADLKPYETTQLQSGDTWQLKNGMTVKILGIHQWATFQIAHEPGKTTVLIAAILIIAGLLGSLRVRRRRFWVRAVPVVAADGTRSTVVTAAGLARTDVGGFVHELDDLAGELGRPTAGDVTEAPATERD